jgi:glycosyltransferase involved in cell wall biosynthesis
VTDTLHIFMPYGRSAASARIRVYGWLEHFGMRAELNQYLGTANTGMKTLINRPLETLRAELDLRRRRHRVPGRVFLHREASPLSAGGLEARLLAGAEFSIYDFDDAMQWDWGTDNWLRRTIPKASKTIRAIQHADRVIAGNETLAEWASSWAREVVVIPSCVDPGTYRPKDSYRLNDPPRLGWVGTPATERYLVGIERPLAEIHRRTGARLTVISSGHQPLGRLAPFTNRVQWSEQQVAQMIREFDVGLMPLNDGLYERGKSGYKLLQYGAAGLPAVGTPVGVSRKLLASIGAPCPRSEPEWVEAVISLFDASEESRQLLGQRGRTVAERQYSYSVWADTWRTATGNI